MQCCDMSAVRRGKIIFGLQNDRLIEITKVGDLIMNSRTGKYMQVFFFFFQMVNS